MALFETVRKWYAEKKKERHIRKIQALYRDLQKYGTLRRDRRIVNRITK